ncbi:hypothetical protein BDV34DRAFT_22401 [Aspergillus parasiticus]|uniref:Uncharacterized protein n=1 Tax=Aspergillus parasiticus TaxID=5067 RepID=A0A5N6D4F8_ASPPA|nr:hypothetical protein BDV34DRAFT_22401 [Aspergillus parasiticus]
MGYPIAYEQALFFSPAPKNMINNLNGKHLQIPERSAVASRTQINLAKYMYVFWSSVAPAFFFAIESFE